MRIRRTAALAGALVLAAGSGAALAQKATPVMPAPTPTLPSTISPPPLTPAPRIEPLAPAPAFSVQPAPIVAPPVLPSGDPAFADVCRATPRPPWCREAVEAPAGDAKAQ